MSLPFEGTYTAIVTPFRDATLDAERAIDWLAYERLVKAQIDGGITGIVPCGTTGESPCLDKEEQFQLVERTVKLVSGYSRAASVPASGSIAVSTPVKRPVVLAGSGSNSTQATIALSQACQKAGADAVMVVVPYYNKPTQEGLVEHYVAVARSVTCPVVVYNIPGRSGVDLTTETLAKIAAAAPNVLAVKEATGNVVRAQEIVRCLGDRMTVLCGDDGLTVPMIAIGARGVISVTSNIYPRQVSRVTRLALEGKFEEARKAHFALLPVHEIMFIESNPSPVKAALAARLSVSDAVRAPLVRLSESARAKVIAALDAYEASTASA